MCAYSYVGMCLHLGMGAPVCVDACMEKPDINLTHRSSGAIHHVLGEGLSLAWVSLSRVGGLVI